MIDILLLILILVVAKQCSKLSISKQTYRILMLGTLLTTTLLTLLILKIESLSIFMNQVCQPLVDIGLGNPKAWKMRTREFDDQIVACYYLCLVGGMVMISIASAYDAEDVKKYRQRDRLGNMIGFYLVVPLVIWWIFYHETYLSGSLWASKSLKVMFNSSLGLAFFIGFVVYVMRPFFALLRAANTGKNQFK